MAPRSFRITPGSTLNESFDLEQRIGDATSADTLKGMFFERILDLAKTSGIDPKTLDPKLVRDYRTFMDYPVSDYYRLITAIGTRLHPRQPNVEAIRRTAVRDFERLASSTVGRVMLSFAPDARATLLQAERMYGAILKGSAKVTAETSEGGVTLHYRNFPGLAEYYPIGTIEGLCRHYGVDYEIEVRVISNRDADYIVRMR